MIIGFISINRLFKQIKKMLYKVSILYRLTVQKKLERYRVKKFLSLVILLGLVPTVSAMMPISKTNETDLNQQLFKEMKPGGSVDKILELIEMVADVDVKDKDDRTVLMWAIIYGRTKVCLALIKKSDDLNLQDGSGMTALLRAVVKGLTKVCLALIEKGADLNLQDGDGITALMRAVVKGRIKVYLALIEKGADLNLQDGDGITALMLAADNDLFEVCLALIEKGADLNIKDVNGDMALCYADHTEICRIILSHAIILPKPSNEGCLLTILCIFNRLKFPKDMRYYILGKLPLESLIGLLMPCKKCPIPLKSGLVEKIKEHTMVQLIPMVLKARERASGEELKNLLDPEKFSDNFVEELYSTVKKVVDGNRLYLYKPVIQADEIDAL